MSPSASFWKVWLQTPLVHFETDKNMSKSMVYNMEKIYWTRQQITTLTMDGQLDNDIYNELNHDECNNITSDIYNECEKKNDEQWYI